jgi:hypothetical protein
MKSKYHRSKPPTPAVAPTLAPCYFCNKEVDQNLVFCYGCGQVICDDCDVCKGNHAGPGHKPEAHLIPNQEQARG